LATAGLPVDRPLYSSRQPGEQILVYRRRHEPRFADLLCDLDRLDQPAERARLVAAEQTLNRRIMAVFAASLRPISPAQSAQEPIHRLFHQRLVDLPGETFPGGRLASFYVGQSFALPGLTLSWAEMADMTLTINGVTYGDSLGALFRAAHQRLRPDRMADAGGVVAHGDAHNANVWVEGFEPASLCLFDPAFAGAAVPSLLAEIKATFHNVFAHPFWLYDPDLADRRFSATVRRSDAGLVIEHDWALSPVRQDLLAAKRDLLWRPLLALLRQRQLLPADWRRVMRLALFLCPTLVMNLRAGAGRHTPLSSLLGLATAVVVGSQPVAGRDPVVDFFDAIAPAEDDCG
jgi:hypothetical protein